MGIDLNAKIPNNVGLDTDRVLQRALEQWQPNFVNWWREAGPVDHKDGHDIWLRTAISVEKDGWAHYDYTRMPEYRWGIFVPEGEEGRRVGFGDEPNRPVWQQVPGELRDQIRRLIVVQADTEPASVEQQRLLARTAPSLYDMRNLFQVNVEEGRHLWAMVYLLHRYFGRDGREEANELLQRRSGGEKPRILETFNEPIAHWLDFFMFAMFTDRDGKFQLGSLAESGFDPLARTCQFMLTEEAHHLFVGENGIDRVIKRTCELMKLNESQDARKQGGIDLPTIQRSINFWFSSSLDLFGGENSSNAAKSFASGLKGRYQERQKHHGKEEGNYPLEMVRDGRVETETISLRNAMNAVLADCYIDDCQRAIDRWNKIIEESGIEFKLKLPNRRFNRHGSSVYSNNRFDVEGNLIDEGQWMAGQNDWLPTSDDRAYVNSLMVPVTEPGKMANWISPPSKGIKGRLLDFEYVREVQAG